MSPPKFMDCYPCFCHQNLAVQLTPIGEMSSAWEKVEKQHGWGQIMYICKCIYAVYVCVYIYIYVWRFPEMGVPLDHPF